MLAVHPDPTVDHVLKTWAPRMIVQGIDYNDLMTTGERIRTWDDWCRESCATAVGHEEFAPCHEQGILQMTMPKNSGRSRCHSLQSPCRLTRISGNRYAP